MHARSRLPLLIALLAAFTGMLTGDARHLEHFYWFPWYSNDSVAAEPDSAVIVSLDNGSLSVDNAAIGSTARQAELLANLETLGARHIYLDMPEAAGTDPDGDAALVAELLRQGDRVTLVMRSKAEYSTDGGNLLLPEARFVPPASTALAASFWYTNVQGVPIESPPAVEQAGKLVPIVSLVASRTLSTGKMVYPDHRLDPASIPVTNSRAILSGAQAPFVGGRDVYVTRTSENVESAVTMFGHGRVPQALIDIATAQNLRQGGKIYFGGRPFLILFVLVILAGYRMRSPRLRAAMYSATALVLLFGPGILTHFGIVTDIGGVILASLVYVPLRLWEKFRQRVVHTSSASGLPNVEALVADGIPSGSDVVAVCISNFEHMLISLPKELHGECSRQIARRLSVAFGGSPIYDNDDGHFVWLVQPFSTDELVAQLEGLKALFAAPLVIGGQVLDTNVHFGLDRNSANKPTNRIKSAIASSSEAVSKLKLYEEYGSERLAAAPWELSLHARIDDALRNGDIWLAFQPQYNLRERRITGAEALIRWTDPERGPIAPDTFILQAERAGRIDTITYWVLEQAVIAGRDIGDEFGRFDMSVNLSARMVDQPTLVERVLDITDRYAVDPACLTFEVTETFNMTNRDVAKENLAALRAFGFALSIDDFGTGYASLAYLSEIETDEIKLDRRFVSALAHSSRDRAIVGNIIKLAHDMGQVTVGEGVEDQQTLDLLRALNCDSVQGYLIGKPTKLPDLRALLAMPGSGQQPAYG